MRRQPIRVMCVDDNELVATAVERRLESDPRFRWVGWVSQLRALFDRVVEWRPDVVLLDIDMPGEDPFLLVPQLKLRRADTRVLMFSAYVHQDYIDRAIDAGAWGYVSKHESIAEVLNAIERAFAGQFVLTNDVIRTQRVVGVESRP